MMMRAQLFALLFVVAAATSVESSVVRKSFVGVDPNQLSCDSKGAVFLLLPHFTDCNKYFICEHGKEVEQKCSADNLIFDFENQSCSWPWATECKLRDRDEVEGSGEDEGDLAWLEHEAAHPSLVIEHTLILNCLVPADSAKRVANKNDCQRYWRCDNGQLASHFCTDGLFFNPVSQQCDFEANVKCGVEQAEEIGSEFIVYK